MSRRWLARMLARETTSTQILTGSALRDEVMAVFILPAFRPLVRDDLVFDPVVSGLRNDFFDH
jgi:hypothetical protein